MGGGWWRYGSGEPLSFVESNLSPGVTQEVSDNIRKAIRKRFRLNIERIFKL